MTTTAVVLLNPAKTLRLAWRADRQSDKVSEWRWDSE
jgi:hypothetical protein